jgi:hypothetical protein
MSCNLGAIYQKERKSQFFIEKKLILLQNSAQKEILGKCKKVYGERVICKISRFHSLNLWRIF